MRALAEGCPNLRTLDLGWCEVGNEALDALAFCCPELATISLAYCEAVTDEGTFGESGWGGKASKVLLQTKGKGFRHEKTKKKRGTYKGGLIDDTEVNSFKFQYSDDGE